MEAVRKCDRVINAGVTVGDGNAAMKEVLELAKELGKLEEEQTENC